MEIITVILMAIGILLYIASIWHYKSALNPLGLFAIIWGTLPFVCSLQLMSSINTFYDETYIALFGSFFSFILGALLVTKRNYRPLNTINFEFSATEETKINRLYLIILIVCIGEMFIKTPALLSDNPLGTYSVATGELFPLLFFHFSGFDPFNPAVLNRRHPKYGVEQFPSFKPLIDEYVEAEYRNGYDTFSKLSYSFNVFEDGQNIMPIHRRLYRAKETQVANANPFGVDSKIFQLLKASKLLSGVKGNAFKVIKPSETAQKGKVVNLFKFGFKFLKLIAGPRRYPNVINTICDLTRLENQTFLLKKK